MIQSNPVQAIKDLIVQQGDALQTWHRSHRARDLIVVLTLASVEYIKYLWDYMHYLYRRLCKKLETRLRQLDVIYQWDLRPPQLDLITVYTLLCCETDGDTWLYTDEQAGHLRDCITQMYLPGPGNRRIDDWGKLQAKDLQKVMKRLVEADVSEHLDYYCTWKPACDAYRYVRTEYKAAEAGDCFLPKEELEVRFKQKYDELVRQAPYKACMHWQACIGWQLALGIYDDFAGLMF